MVTRWHHGRKQPFTNLVVLARDTYQVNGHGYECFKMKKTVVTHENLVFARSKEESEEVIFLTKGECEYMVSSKKCSNAV